MTFMEQIELKKRLEKKKAYLVCLMIFLTLSIPTLMNLAREFKLAPALQAVLLAGILVLIISVYKKMNQVRARIKTLFR